MILILNINGRNILFSSLSGWQTTRLCSCADLNSHSGIYVRASQVVV